MTIDDAVITTNLLATGKVTGISASRRAQIIALLDYYQRRWAREPDTDWNSLYDPAYRIGNVTANDRFDLDSSTVRKLSTRFDDAIRIVHSNNTAYTDYALVKADALSDLSYGVNKESSSGWYAAQIGSELVFNHTFTSSDAQFGGKIYVPAYLYTDPITDENPATDEVQVNDPDWLCARAAAELARNNIILRPRYPELIQQANEIMTRMKADNDDAQIEEVQRPWTPFTGNRSGWSD